ncbi:MAG: hypothetical protein NVSMB57_07660 [Actinomycetota bacterium]
MTDNDSYTASLRALAAARSALFQELISLESPIESSRSMRAEGLKGIEVAQALESPETRDRIVDALARFSTALARTRAEAVRVMIEEDGLTFTQIAEFTGRKRQLISKLYHELKARKN